MRVHYTFFSVRLWSNEGWLLLFQPLFAFNQLRQQRLILGELLLLIVYDLLGRSRDERFIRELAFKLRLRKSPNDFPQLKEGEHSK